MGQMKEVSMVLQEFGIEGELPPGVLDLANHLLAARQANEFLTSRLKEAERWAS